MGCEFALLKFACYPRHEVKHEEEWKLRENTRTQDEDG